MRPPIAISLLLASATLGGMLGAALSVETPEAAIPAGNARRASTTPPGAATPRTRRRVAVVVQAPDAAAVRDDAENDSAERVTVTIPE